VRQALAKPKPI